MLINFQLCVKMLLGGMSLENNDIMQKNTEVFKIRCFNDVHTCPMRERMLNKVEATLSFVRGVTAPKLINH